ncbi:HepT-like ribonuclease domain-containing protein [uncultured Methanobrevibacter sp.]|uniref:HepT-like ribonuclease domain-containing protein n=1 Tax=uncultured Methanobrevibacter sp. TaxID=253161 RepID=UPI00320932DE
MQKHSDIGWSGFIGMRVIHAHHYEGIILDLLWDTIKVDVPELKKYVEKILNE